MPRRRDLSNIPKHVYRELYHFCLQYPIWEEKIRGYRSPKAARLSNTPRGGRVSKPVEASAERAMALTGKVKLIQDTIKETCPRDPEAQRALLLNVTQDINYTDLYMRHDILIPEKLFKQYRRKFFHRLAEKKGRI